MIRRIGFLALALMLAVPFSASAIQLTDYTFPDTYFQEAYFKGGFNLQHGNQQQTSYNGFAALDYTLDYNTLPQTFHVDTIGSRFDFVQDAQKQPGADDSRNGFDLKANANFDKYYKDTSWLGYGDILVDYRKQLGAGSADDPYVKVGIGAGYGRVIIATPLAKAIRVVEELRKYNVMTADPSDACYLEVARMIDKEPEFKSKWGLKDYEQYWYKEIEDILNKEGLLKNGVLGVIGVLRLREVLIGEAVTFPRYAHGWVAKAGVGYIVSNYEGADEDPTLDAKFIYALPITNRLQFTDTFSYSTILGNSVGHQFTNDMYLGYKLLENIVWVNDWTVDMTLPKDSEKRKIVHHLFTSDFIYYITNTLSADLTFKLAHNNEDDSKNEIEKSVALSFWYRLW
jgi:hypothetical protein